MAIDIRQEQQQRDQRTPPPARPARLGWAVALTVIAIVALTGAFLAVALSEDPAPSGGTLLTYQDGALTSVREGGEYVVIPETTAGYVDTDVEGREWTPPVDTSASEQKAQMAAAGITSLDGGTVTDDVTVQDREGSTVATGAEDVTVQDREGSTTDAGADEQKAQLAEAGITSLDGSGSTADVTVEDREG